MKRVFLCVLDSLGIGEALDAEAFGDVGAHTLKSISRSGRFHVPNFLRYGLGNISALSFLGKTENPLAAYARLRERSAGKDTTIGHWEIAGVVSEHPLPTYPNGFPPELIQAFSERIGRNVLCNRPYSGTEVINVYGDEHVRTGKPIVYTSADSVFQIAAHEEIIPPDELYAYCRIARTLCCGPHAVGRVIARPFIGESGRYTRTANRRDFSLEPPAQTLPDALQADGRDVIAVGKIADIFAGRGITEHIPTHGNEEGMRVLSSLAKRSFDGLCFANLVDFDMLYGHRNDIDGYAGALSAFDAWLPSFLSEMRVDDLLFLTADHGCDPGFRGTDHTREDVPLLVFGKRVLPTDLGVQNGFTCIAASIASYFGVAFQTESGSFLPQILRKQ